ncbi:hypothetical protein EII14_02845 [Alloprevotella sp. OH1205_COT-284]|uniref:TonB-dependent receptor plug domain-containing protein n=1 Tax=Alloprevotella sp. OH1205_COT-284 TaxID=2491043 RepID=UPI000F5FB328|nr:TonB-dependent receptor plug domain-containing protein [Alloprevotella sp. OH1205_COT-284]RRD80262.1 hypothetical protein EII14_02845 [Alloprevotella sp. OH1205_COT-284]
MKHTVFLLFLSLAASTFGQIPADTSVVRADSTTIEEINLGSALIVGKRQNKVQSPLMGVSYLRPEYIKSIPTMFGEADVIKALQMQPGVSVGIDGFAGMMVRGGNDDQNLFLIDGNPVYQMNHAGGLFSAYNVEAVRDVAFYKSSFPSRYGGRLSSVVDIITKPGDMERYAGSFGVGLTSANINVGGPIVKGRTAFHFSLRRSWLDLLTTPALALANSETKADGEKNTGSYIFHDINLHLSHRLGDLGTLAFVGYAGQDRLAVGGEYWNPNPSSSHHYDEFYDKIDMSMRWGNMLGALKWQLPVGDRWLHNLTLSYTRYGSKYRIDTEFSQGKPGTAAYEREKSRKEMHNGIDDIGLRSQWLWTPRPTANVRFGIDYMHHRFTPEQRREASENPLIGFARNEKPIHAHDISPYADVEVQPREWLKINAGLRLSDFYVKSKNYFCVEPRLAANFLLTPSVSLKAGYARMSQYVQQVSDTYISMPTDYWMPITDHFSPLVGDQVSVGAYYTRENKWNFSLEAWYKHMNHLLEYREGHAALSLTSSWTDKLTAGKGEAYGLDLQIEKNFGRLAGYLGYGWLWTERTFPEINGGRPFPSKYDNRHKLNVALSYRASRRVELNASWTLMSGNLVTLAFADYEYTENITPDIPKYPSDRDQTQLNYISAKNNYRLPPYHRLDVGINFHRFHKSGRRSTWNISLYNAYSRMNPVVVRKKEERFNLPGSSEQRYRTRYQKLSFFPVIPSVSYTLKF